MKPDRYQPDSRPGTYVLVLQLLSNQSIQAGAMGTLELSSGWYAYVGSAFGSGGVAARCGHHRQISARPHWHIDYLRAVTDLRAIWFSHDKERREHQWAELLSESRGARVPFAGFGATDCRCVSHLLHFLNPPSFCGFRWRLRRNAPHHAIVRQELTDSQAV